MGATLDGRIEETQAIFESKFMLPWSFSEEAAARKHLSQLQHNMCVANARSAVLSIITGGGQWVQMTIPADAIYQHLVLVAEKKFWRCVQTGERPQLFNLEPPQPRMEAVRSIDMSGSNAWAEFATLFRRNAGGRARARTRQVRVKGPDARRCQRGIRPRGARQTVEGGRDQL